MIDVRAKGATAETKARDALRKVTKLNWERVPGSGALDPKHLLKGDLYIPAKDNLYCVEVKHYAEDYLTSQILTSKAPQLLIWWEQTARQATQVSRKPLLIFKFDRSKLFVAFTDMPETDIKYIYLDVGGYSIYISILEDWLVKERPIFIK
jgi:hypothetical protein